MAVVDEGGGRRIGDYVLGRRLGTGSFAVVWKATHRVSGLHFAIKQIDTSKLNHRVLLKEISILNTIQHPNIIRLFDVINTPHHIYLVMEFCDGGDLYAYILPRTKISVPLARHFIHQLAAGLQVLNEKHLIHRDLKPQNLFLSNDDKFPILKIGDFGFARHLNSQGLAETICGSPLYMAPEVILNNKYDAKADLWSVGAILFQLVTGKPPFQGNTQFELFQNILKSTALRFPKGLDEDCVDLCRSLLRNDPVERLSFQEFFNHQFLAELQLPVDSKLASFIPVTKSQVVESSADPRLYFPFNKRLQLQQEHHLISSYKNESLHETLNQKDRGNTSSPESGHDGMQNIDCGEVKKIDSGETNSPVYGSMRSIEEDYVIVNTAHFTSMASLSSSVEASGHKSSKANVSVYQPNTNSRATPISLQTKESIDVSSGSLKGQASYDLEMSSASTISKEVQRLSISHPSTRLQLLHQYVNTLSELVQEKFNAGLFLESLSVQLVVLAIWKEILRVCSAWVASTVENQMILGSYSGNESTALHDRITTSCSNSEGGVDFFSPSSVSMWAEKGFIRSFDNAEKLSQHLQNIDENAEMPDAMEIIFQTALAAARSDAVDEFMQSKLSGYTSYATSKLLFSFIVGEATTLPLNPPFSLRPDVRRRIHSYITSLEYHIAHCQMS